MLGVEYLNRFECYFLNSAADTVRFVRDVDHPNCRMMYDTFHANIEEKNAAEAIRTAPTYTVHVHISENDRSTPGAGQHPLGRDVRRRSRKTGYDGWMVIEAFGLALPELAAATKIWRRMYQSEEQLARDGLAFMKKHVETPVKRLAAASGHAEARIPLHGADSMPVQPEPPKLDLAALPPGACEPACRSISSAPPWPAC